MLLKWLHVLLIILSINLCNAETKDVESFEEEILNDHSSLDDQQNYYSYAYFRGLDKISDAVVKIRAQTNGVVNYFGKLQFKVRKCWRSPSHGEEESAAFIEVYEKGQSLHTQKIFTGWVFSNNSFLTNIEHRRYDLRLLGCGN